MQPQQVVYTTQPPVQQGQVVYVQQPQQVVGQGVQVVAPQGQVVYAQQPPPQYAPGSDQPPPQYAPAAEGAGAPVQVMGAPQVQVVQNGQPATVQVVQTIQGAQQVVYQQVVAAPRPLIDDTLKANLKNIALNQLNFFRQLNHHYPYLLIEEGYNGKTGNGREFWDSIVVDYEV